ncbi:amino acid adenylation domain-containing protein [bacterium]|nr:amino acid adenylation domain-containing protein [bacterium]
MIDISKRIADLSPEKRELLLRRLDKEVGSVLRTQIRPKKRDANSFPLSSAQQQLWFLNQFEPGSFAYNEPAAFRLTGSLNVAALEQSLNEIVRRHEVLRTTFPTVDEQPVQAIAPDLNLTLPVVDLRELPETEWEVKAQQLATEATQQVFDLAKGPLLRVKLLRLAKEEHILLLTMHHIIFDGWSSNVFFRELAALYKAFSTGRPSLLPELPIQYVDFAVWQQQWLQSEVLESQLSYWKQQLGDCPPVLELYTDRPRPAVRTDRGETQSLPLPKSLLEALKALSRQEGVTLFMTLLAAFKTLLYRYTGQEDIIVGTPIAGRNWVEIEGLIGLFLNALAMRTDLYGNPTFRQLLSRVREVSLGAYAHQDLPFERLVEELQPERTLSHTPLFQVMFVFENTPTPPLEILPGLTLSPPKVNSKTAKYDLTLYMKERAEELRCSLEYNIDLFDATTITRMLGHFQTLLEGIVANPYQHISYLPLLTEAERQQMLVAWNDTQTDYPQDESITQLFEAQVERSPEATAFIFEDQKLSYKELNRRANQIAHYLQTLGVGPEVVVGLCMERSLEMVVGLLGILKAGGAYLPLDPAYPKERLAFMFEDTQVPVLLTKKQFVEILPKDGAQVVCLDLDDKVIARQSEENPVSDVTTESMAYAIYTSGSTGHPKGVAAPHKQILNRLSWMWASYPFKAGEVACQKTALNFVDSIWELLGPLLQGVPTVIIPDKILKKTSEFVRVLAEHDVTRLWVVPSLLRVMLDTVPNLQSRLPKLRFWFTGGEAISLELFQRFQESMPQSVLYNIYGTSEVWDVTLYEPDPQHKELPRVPIGRPIANMQTYILDAHLQPVPIGVPGELHVGGVGLAQGYINRPELTTEKFIPNPFSDEPEERLYKTGDLARYLPDGNIEFLGRMDHQIKIRGFRIEPGEIEAALGQHPAVLETVVLAREDVPGDKRLVAYVVPNQKQTPATSELRRFLKQKLPDYMVPSAFVQLDSLPLTPNGKVDRRALPAPDTARAELEGTFVPPRDELELQLTKIWEKVLGNKPIGVRDNFFELGGHSLLAVRLFAQIEKIFGKNLPLATLFQAPTVEQLASILRQEGWSPPLLSSLVAIQSGGSKRPFFCVHACTGEILIYADLARHLGKEQPFYALRAQGLDGEQAPYTRIEDTAAHYIKEIRAIQPEGPYFIGGGGVGGKIAFEMAQQLRAQGEKVALLVLMDSGSPRLNSSGSNPPGSRKSLSYYVRRSIYHLQRRQLTHVLKNTLKSVLKKYHRRIGYVFMPRHIRYIQHVMDALNRASGSYVPQVYPGRITYFLAEKRQGFSGSPQTRIGAWYELAAGGLDVRVVPGDHLGMLKEPHVRVLAEQLRACLDEARADDSDVNHPLLVEQDDTQAGYPKVEVWSPLLSSLVPLQPGGSKPPLFCVPAAASTALSFAYLARHLDRDQPVYGLQPLGMDGEQVPYTRVEDMAAHYIKEIRTLQPEGPYFLGGMCFGNLVAFEMAQQLRAQDQQVSLLALFDGLGWIAKSVTSAKSRKSPTHYVHRLVYHLQHKQLTRVLLGMVKSKFKYSKFKSIIVYLFGSLQDRRIQRVFDAAGMAARSYVVRPYSGRITLLMNSEQNASEAYKDLFWRVFSELAAGGFDYHVIPGGHYTIFREPYVQVLAEKLRACLDEAQVDDSDVNFQAPTVEQLASRLCQKGWSAPWSSLVPIQPGGSKPPLFCVPPSASTVLGFADLARHLSPEQPFYGLQPLGMDGEQTPHTRVEDMAAHYIKEIRTLQPEGPYFLVGRCFGCIVAFEMGKQLGAQGEKVALMAMLDPGYLPALYPERLPELNPSRKSLIYYVRRLVYHLQRRQFTSVLARRVKRIAAYMFIPRERHLQRVEVAHSRALRNYVPQAYPGLITLFQTHEDNTTRYPDCQLKWSELTAGGVDCHVVPGPHIDMLREPNVRVLAEQLRACLNEALANNSDVNHP